MAYDEKLAARIRAALGEREGLREQRMFGGIGWMLRGNMCVGILGDALIVRFDVEDEPEVLAAKHVRPFDPTGRPMAGWAFVDPPATRTAKGVARWVDRALAFNATLPPKLPGEGRRRAPRARPPL